MSDFNDKVIADFNEHGGQPGGYFKNAPILLLHTKGAKTGLERTQPLMYLRESDGPWHVFASYGGADKDPAWFRNLVAYPDIEMSIGDGTTIERIPVHATVVEGAERDTIYAKQASLYPQFAGYEEKTSREKIPVVALTRR